MKRVWVFEEGDEVIYERRAARYIQQELGFNHSSTGESLIEQGGKTIIVRTVDLKPSEAEMDRWFDGEDERFEAALNEIFRRKEELCRTSERASST